MSSFLPDEPIDNAARFGFDVYSKALSNLLKSGGLETPFTIAIHGDWGSGKTSLMKTVSKELEIVLKNEIRVRTIWFDAWEFEKIQLPLWKIFLNRIIMDLQEQVKDNKLKEKLKATGEGILILVSDLALKTIGTSLNEIEGIKSSVWKDIEKIKSLGENFSECIESALKDDPSKPERLVVFVDDLDRCLPDQCVEVFESIKLFLNSEKCIFVIGMNKEQICRAFEAKFKERGLLGLNYMEKFIQLQFDLPRKNPMEVQSFLMEFASKQLKESPKTIELIARFIEPNPRKVKRWLNSVTFLEEMFKVRKQNQIITTDVDVSLVSIWLFLKSFFSDFAGLIENNPLLLNVSIRIATGKGSEDDKRKIGVYVIEKRLADFLATLKSDYDEDQLGEVVYLSKLTPIEQVSTMPSEMLSRITETSDEELSDELDRLTEYGLSTLVDRIIDNLSGIQEYHEYKKNMALFGLLDRIMLKGKEESKILFVFEKIRSFKEGSSWGSRYFSGRLAGYASKDVIKKMLLENGYPDKIVGEFVSSNSFEEAKNNSAMLLNFAENLSGEQIPIVVKACIENNQIYCSFGARTNMSGFLIYHKDLISKEEKIKIKELMRINIPE